MNSPRRYHFPIRIISFLTLLTACGEIADVQATGFAESALPFNPQQMTMLSQAQINDVVHQYAFFYRRGMHEFESQRFGPRSQYRLNSVLRERNKSVVVHQYTPTSFSYAIEIEADIDIVDRWPRESAPFNEETLHYLKGQCERQNVWSCSLNQIMHRGFNPEVQRHA